MKKEYRRPDLQVVTIEVVAMNQISNVKGNTNLKSGGGSSGPARGRQQDDWDDEEDY